MANEPHSLLVSFEINWEHTEKGRAQYNAIYSAMHAAVQDRQFVHEWWGENTSFYVVRSREDATAFLARVWKAAKMRATKDRLVVLDADRKAGVAFGRVQDPSLFALLPFVKELPPEYNADAA